MSVRSWTFEKIIRVLRCFDDGVRIKSLGFEVLKDDLAFHGGIQNRTFNWSVARRRLYSLTTSIPDYRIDEEHYPVTVTESTGTDSSRTRTSSSAGRKRPVVRFEIRCQLLIRHYQKHDKTINFSIWKRYSELKAMHEILKEQFEWQLDGANQGRGTPFPPDRYIQSFLYGPTSDAFLETRRRELDDYWSILQTCNDVFDFADPASHRFSKDMADFLSIETYLHSSDVIHADSVTTPGPMLGPDLGPGGDVEGGGDVIPATSSGLNLDVSGLSDIPPTSESGRGELKLDESSSSLGLGRYGEIVIQGGLNDDGDGDVDASPGAARSSSRTPHSGTGGTGNGGSSKRKKKRRKAKAKPAFQRRLLDDL